MERNLRKVDVNLEGLETPRAETGLEIFTKIRNIFNLKDLKNVYLNGGIDLTKNTRYINLNKNINDLISNSV